MESRNSSLRIFGLTEEKGEDLNGLKASVIENVCEVACPGDYVWSKDIAFARWVGDFFDDHPRAILVKFEHDFKFSLFGGGNSLRERHLYCL